MTHYLPTQKSLSSHPIPQWFLDAKLGILIQWGLFSVPGWASYCGNPVTSSPIDLPNVNLVTAFNKASPKWNPVQWAETFQRAGARYVIMPAKQADGFLLWPSENTNPKYLKYASKEDLVGAIAHESRKCNLEFGIYYSGGIDRLFDHSPIGDGKIAVSQMPVRREYSEYVEKHWRELIKRFEPSVLWNDIGCPSQVNLANLFSDYYNQLPLGVVNDRFGQSQTASINFINNLSGRLSSQAHFDFRTIDYDAGLKLTPRKWETQLRLSCTDGIASKNSEENGISFNELVQAFIDVVSKNGNLLLTVTPDADGKIPATQTDLLEGLGKWLAEYGESIYGTRTCFKAEGKTTEGLPLRFTRKDKYMYVFVMGLTLEHEVVLQDTYFPKITTVEMLGYKGKLGWEQTGKHVRVQLPPKRFPSPAHIFKVDLGVALPDDPKIVIADLKSTYRPPKSFLDRFRRKKLPEEEPAKK